MNWFGYLVAVAVVAMASMSANAVLLIDAGSSSSFQTFTEGDYVAGTEFFTPTPLTIRSLGRISGGNGITGTDEVGLWAVATESLLAQATISSSSVAVASEFSGAQWLMENITPVTIGPGIYRVAASMDSLAAGLSNDKVGNGVFLSSGYVRTEVPGGGFAYPDLSFNIDTVRATLSEDFAVEVVPEPASLALLGAGGLALLRRRRT